jgi:hypothetical protein
MKKKHWRKLVKPKQVWGSQPSKENKPGSSYTERAYLALIERAMAKGEKDALDPAKGETDCWLATEEERLAWRTGFKAKRRAVALG